MKNKSLSWVIIERATTLVSLAAAIIGIAPFLLAGWGFLQQGLYAVVPAWFVLVTTISALLVGYSSRNLLRMLTKERVIYDARQLGIRLSDFRPVPVKVEGDDKIAQGKPDIIDGVLALTRTNDNGRYELHLCEYLYKGEHRDFLPKSDIMRPIRRLHVVCKAKVSKGSHILDFVVRNRPTDARLDDRSRIIDDQQWADVDFDLRVPHNVDCSLKIYDRKVSDIGSTIYIKDFVFAEYLE